jgi:small-conductance mechanosensitive channel
MEPLNEGDLVQNGEDKYIVGEIGERKVDLIGEDGQKYSTPLHKFTTEWFKVLAKAESLSPFYISRKKIVDMIQKIDKEIDTLDETHNHNGTRIEHLNIKKNILNKLLEK